MPGDPPSGHAALRSLHTRLYRYQHLAAIVGWDRNAMMPPGGNEARANLREMPRDWREATGLPESLIEAKTLAGARIWSGAISAEASCLVRARRLP